MSIVHLSASAIAEIKRMQAKQNLPDSWFHIAVKPGGCSGLYYELSLVPPSEQVDEKLILLDCQGIKVIIDAQSCEYVKNLGIDYSEDLMGGGFRFENQQAIATCGCGNSFAVDIDKSEKIIKV